MELDGKRQRNALTAAENAITALGAADPDRARRAAAKAIELDQIGAYAGLGPAVDEAAAQLERSGAVSDAAWEAITAAVGPGPLAGLVAREREPS